MHNTPHLVADACVCMCGDCVVYTMATARKRDSNWCICPDCQCLTGTNGSDRA